MGDIVTFYSQGILEVSIRLDQFDQDDIKSFMISKGFTFVDENTPLADDLTENELVHMVEKLNYTVLDDDEILSKNEFAILEDKLGSHKIGSDLWLILEKLRKFRQ